MNHKKICVIANGYAEEMMATKLMSELRINLNKKNKQNDYQFVGGSLVSSGKWYQDESFPVFFSGGMSPSGGFPTKSWKGFFADLKAGAFFAPFHFMKMIKDWNRYNLDVIIVVGDFLLMMLAVPALRKKNIPLIFIPTAKSDYIQSHFKIEKNFIKKFATMSFPRDQLTSDDFSNYEIPSRFEGNLIQDLLDINAKRIDSDLHIVALLPGSREESYKNLQKTLMIVEKISMPIYWAFVQAGSLEQAKIEEIFLNNDWIKSNDNNISTWSKGIHNIYCYKGSQFDSVALSCDFAVSLAGTAGEQIVGLGKPVIGFDGTGPQSTSVRMEDNQKLLGDAFIYEKDYPNGVLNKIELLLKNPQERQRRGQVGLDRMGQTGATKKIAEYIVDNYLEKG